MLKLICEPLAHSRAPQFQGTADERIPNEARFWATRLIHSLNMAMFLGVTEEFFSDVENISERPRIGDILDIVHPTSPRYESYEIARKVESYCQKVLRHHESPSVGAGGSEQHTKDLLHLAVHLSRTGRVIVFSDPSEAVLIPLRALETFTTTQQDTKNKYNEFRVTRSSKVQLWMSFIQDYVKMGYEKQVDQFAMWDRLRLASSATNANSTMNNWFLTPERYK